MRPGRVILPVSPGGGLDYIARAIMTRLTGRPGQAVVIDNRPGAGGDIGAVPAGGNRVGAGVIGVRVVGGRVRVSSRTGPRP